MIGPLLAAAALLMTVEPAELRPAPGAHATVRLLCETRPTLVASTGTLEELREESPGHWSARYLGPNEAVPQVALLAASAGGEVAFAKLRLFGLGDALVKTRPRAWISVTIGSEQFGPVRADLRGVALVPVVVPPGVGVAMHGGKPIDLQLPRTQALQLALAQAEAGADQPAPVEVRLLVVDPTGEPRSGARLVLQASSGQVGPVRELGDGLYAATWTVVRERAGSDSIRAFLEEAPQFVASAALQRTAGPAASITLSGAPASLTAGAGELLLAAELRDAAGNLSPDQLRASATPGAAIVEPLGPGAARVRVQVPSALGEAKVLHLSLSSARGPATAALDLPLLPSTPAQARLELDRSAVRADGAEQVPLRVLVEDRFGNAIPEVALRAETEEGAISPPTFVGHGAFGATYTPPLLREPGSALLRVHASDALGELRVPLEPSQSLLALSPKLGMLSNFGRINSPLVALEAALRFERLGTQFAALIDASYFFAAHDDAVVTSGQSVNVHTRADYFALAAGLSYRPFVAAHAQAFFTLAPSLLFQRGTQQFTGQPQLAQGATTAGLLLGAGVELRLHRFVPFVEARFSWHSDPLLFTLQNPVRGFALLVGSRFEAL